VIRTALLTTLAVAVAAGFTLAGPAAPDGRDIALPSDGERLYRTYCASCHGTTGAGDGPVADLMRKRPPDLTQFAARNGGVFPAVRMRRVIEGWDVPSHGDREMPVWGDVFRMLPDATGKASAAARIDALTRYIESIQVRAAH
jgi:mono/diheme cytochrome c family protein